MTKLIKLCSKSLKIGVNIVSVFVIMAAILFIGPIFLHIRPYIVLSGSMEPSIPTGSIVYIDTKFPAKNLQIGDTIAYQLEDISVTHRITEINEKGFVTKGDANNATDFQTVPFEHVIGKMRFTIPYAGFFVERIRNIYVYSALVLFFLTELYLTIHNKRK